MRNELFFLCDWLILILAIEDVLCLLFELTGLTKKIGECFSILFDSIEIGKQVFHIFLLVLQVIPLNEVIRHHFATLHSLIIQEYAQELLELCSA